MYGAVSALLASTYVLGVLALSTLFRPLTGGNDIAVAGSTLVVVALFQPLQPASSVRWTSASIAPATTRRVPPTRSARAYVTRWTSIS